MRRQPILGIFLAAALFLAGCSPLTAKPTPGPKGDPTGPAPTVGLSTRPAFLETLRALLAKQHNLTTDQVIIEEYQPARWPNSCLGLPAEGEMCAQTITPGYLVVVSLPSGSLELHTDSSGLNFRQTTLESPPGERPIALTWQRQGGFAGICQRLIVYLDGGYRLEDCARGNATGEGKLSEADYKKLQDLQGQFTDFRWQSVPPANSADMFTEELSFNGAGSQTMPESAQQELFEYLAQVVTSLPRQSPTGAP